MTSAKRITINSNYTTWNCNITEGCTKRKSVGPNTCNTIWNYNIFKRLASPKSLCSNAGYAIGNDIACFFRSVGNNCCFVFVK